MRADADREGARVEMAPRLVDVNSAAAPAGQAVDASVCVPAPGWNGVPLSAEPQVTSVSTAGAARNSAPAASASRACPVVSTVPGPIAASGPSSPGTAAGASRAPDVVPVTSGQVMPPSARARATAGSPVASADRRTVMTGARYGWSVSAGRSVMTGSSFTAWRVGEQRYLSPDVATPATKPRCRIRKSTRTGTTYTRVPAATRLLSVPPCALW